MKKYYIKTFGCEMNKADSEKINMILLQSGFAKTPDYKTADLIILNTCSVRQKGEDRVFGVLKEVKLLNKERAKQNKKDIVVGITGCMVRKTGMNKKYLEQIPGSSTYFTSNHYPNNPTLNHFSLEARVTGEKRVPAREIEYLNDKSGIFNNDDKLFPRMPNLDFTLRIEEIKYLNLILTHIYGEKIGSDDKFDDYLKMAQLRENKFSSSVIIQTGCDNFCTFCIVPYTRGREVSREHNDIIEEVKKLALDGVKEISLVGQNVNSYGKQKNLKLWNEEKSSWQTSPLTPLLSGEGNKGKFVSPFRALLDDINKIEGIDRIRFTSSNPHDMTTDILDAHFDLDKTCNYLHFALQSGNDEMLKRMNRRHTYTDFKKMVEYLRSRDPFFSISTDIIVGYSGETDEMFQDTIKAIKELEIDFVYIARYSVRNGTIASKIYPDDVSDDIKANRWHILNSVLEENVKKRGEKMIGNTFELLISGEKDEQFFGRTRNFKEVFFPKKDGLNIGDLVKVKITNVDGWILVGELV